VNRQSRIANRESDALGLYIHIPFCTAICNYCNFNRGLFDPELKTRYVAALCGEIARVAVGRDREPLERPARLTADTIFFGGGTPSLLDPQDVSAIVHACRNGFDVLPHAEVTLETNPETVDRAKLEAFRAAGVNRLSFGVQSFQDEELRRLGRIHSAARARAAITEARLSGFSNVSMDLMMWLPGQSISQWLQNVEGLIAAEPDHASLYLLELYPNAPLKEDMARAGWSLAPDDDAAEMYLRGMARLEEAGLIQYEISNVARTSFESRHNLKYWTDGQWLGFGSGAHSTFGGARWKNVAGTEDYISRIQAGLTPEVERRLLTSDEQLEEALFTGLRLCAGIDVEGIAERYDCDVWARYGEALRPFIEEGWLVVDQHNLRLTRAGMLMANEVMAVFV
jgi:oxygen-independent coproporphyrinogen-3 oxidase